jgi:hypothetical protein
MLIGATAAQADTISYTFTGVNGVAGTDWTLVDPNGYIPDGTNVVNLLTTSTDFFSLNQNGQLQDYGPLIGIGDAGQQNSDGPCVQAATPCFEINMAITNPFGGQGPYLIPFLFAGMDGTSGTFTDLEEGSTLTITDVPEPGSAILTLSGVGLLGLMLVMRKRNAQGLP